MKKICLWTFSFLIFLLSFHLSFAKSDLVFAQTATSSSHQEINYELPYPGLLPDSPLYFLRIIRDKTIGFLISDPLKKAEFNLLQADKRLNAGIYLFNKGKTSLALSTVSKAENYFGEALDRMREAKKEGRDIGGIQEKLRRALGKHEQELKNLIRKASINFRAGFEKEEERVTGFEKWLSQ